MAGEGEVVALVLVGPIDERCDLAALRGVQTGRLVLDLEGVTRINSVGVGEWIRTMQAIPESVEVVWERASVALVRQMSMIANFHGRSRIRSFHAPYYCPACDVERDVLLEASALSRAVAPERTCPDCGAPMEFDEVEEDYFGAILEANQAP